MKLPPALLLRGNVPEPPCGIPCWEAHAQALPATASLLALICSKQARGADTRACKTPSPGDHPAPLCTCQCSATRKANRSPPVMDPLPLRRPATQGSLDPSTPYINVPEGIDEHEHPGDDLPYYYVTIVENGAAHAPTPVRKRLLTISIALMVAGVDHIALAALLAPVITMGARLHGSVPGQTCHVSA